MQLLQRCDNCRTPFTIKDDEIVQALAFAKEHNHKYYSVDCPSCGKPNKISAALLQKSAPKTATQQKPAPTSGSKSKSPRKTSKK